MDEHFFIYDDQFFAEGEMIISAGNRSLRYGDGLFETMRMQEDKILNIDFHFERFLHGLKLLRFEIPPHFTINYFIQKTDDLLQKNRIKKNARIRLMAFRGDGSIFNVENNLPHYILEAWPLSAEIKLNEKGLDIDVFTDGAKSNDPFANIKSNNYLLSVMGGLFAKENKLDDCLLLNSLGRVCESAIANVFIIKGETIYTPPLSEGCVAGVMRRWMLEKFSLKDYAVLEKNLSIDEVLNADELFLTNSVSFIRWVKSCRKKNYGNDTVKEIFQQVIKNIRK